MSFLLHNLVVYSIFGMNKTCSYLLKPGSSFLLKLFFIWKNSLASGGPTGGYSLPQDFCSPCFLCIRAIERKKAMCYIYYNVFKTGDFMRGLPLNNKSCPHPMFWLLAPKQNKTKQKETKKGEKDKIKRASIQVSFQGVTRLKPCAIISSSLQQKVR